MLRMWFAAFILLAMTSSLAACSSGSNTSIGIIGTPMIQLPSSGTTGSATLALVGATSAQFTVSATGFGGGFTASSSNTAVATVTPTVVQTASNQRRAEDVAGGKETFTVTAHANGTATITVTDAVEGSASFTVVVTGIAPGTAPTAAPAPSSSATPAAVPNVVSLTSVGQTQAVTVSEPGYTGAFTATSANTAVAAVSPPSAPGAFTITAVSAGTTTITFADANNSTGTVAVTVTITSGTIDSKGRK
jgi:hypothetical protein